MKREGASVLYAAVLIWTQQKRNLHEEIVVLLRLSQTKDGRP